MQFTINLVSKTYLDSRIVNRWCALIIVLLLIALSWNVYRTAWSAGEHRRLLTDISVLEGKFSQKAGDVSEKDFKQMTTTISYYNALIRKKSINWVGLLDQLEQVTPEGIALSVVQPDAKDKVLRIEGRAKNFKLVQSYLEKLEDSKYFTAVALLSHADIKSGERSNGVQFSISCKAGLP